jgi:hypothetical protein
MNINVPPLPGPPVHARRPIGEANDATNQHPTDPQAFVTYGTALWDSCNERN